MGSEKAFENRVKKFLKEEECWFLKYWGGAAYTKSGIPDLLVCCNGYFLGVEIKSDTGKPSELQLWNIEQIKNAGGHAMVLYPKDYEAFKGLIHKLNRKG